MKSVIYVNNIVCGKILEYLLILLISWMDISICKAQTPELIVKTGLATIFVTTENREEPTCKLINHPEGAMGGAILAEPIQGSLIMVCKSDTLYQSGSYNKGVSGMTIKVRENTPAWKDKKPYKIKLQKKADIIAGLDDYKEKDWILIKESESDTIINEMSLRH